MATHDVAPGAAGGFEGDSGRCCRRPHRARTGRHRRRRRWADWPVGCCCSPVPSAPCCSGCSLVEVLRWDWWAVGDFGTLRLRTLDVGTSRHPAGRYLLEVGLEPPRPAVLLRCWPGPSCASRGRRQRPAAGRSRRQHRRHGGVPWSSRPAPVDEALALTGSGARPSRRRARSGRAARSLEPLHPDRPSVRRRHLGVADGIGDRVAAVVLVVAGSFAAQAHVAGRVAVGALFAVGAVGLVWRGWRGPDTCARRSHRGHRRRRRCSCAGCRR